MDPVSIVGLVEGSVSLAVQCGSVAKILNNIAGQYKYAKLTISTMVQNLDIMQLAWDRIGVWSNDGISADDENFTQRLKRFLETGTLVLDALEEDLLSYDVSNMTFSQRSRLVWNETILQGHQTRIRDQAQSMCLLLQAVQLPTTQATTSLLQQSEGQFMKSDESAFSIVPSKMSSRLSMSTGPSSYRNSISSYASMVYSRLSFEDDLFTARVYKRNYRSPRLRRFWEKKPDHDHESVTSRQEVHQVVVAESKVSRPFKVSTTVRSSPMVVNSEAGNSNTGPIMISHISDVHSEGENQDPKDPLMNMGQELTTGGLEVTTLMISRNCDSLHVCPIHSSFIEDIGFMEPLLQNGGPDYDSSHILSELMYCARGIRWLPLHVFAVTGNLPVVQLLLEKGVSVSAEMKYGIQAIHLGARNGSITVLAALIEAGADVNCKDRDGYQPLHYLSDSQDRPDVIQYLAEQGAEVDSSLYSRLDNSDEQTPVYLACKNDFVGILEVLISLYALAGEFSTLKTKRAFDAAILHRSPLSLDFLLRFGFDPNNRRFDGCIGLDTFVMTFYNPNSPRDLAADKSVLQLLLKHTDLLAEDQSGHTLLSRLFRLQQITEEEDLELARLFLESLPEHKNFEANLLRSMMRSKDTEVDHRGMSLRSDRSLISAPVMAENSLGWG